MKLTGLKLNEFVELVASNSPAPGGGSVAALTAASGAGLLCMVARLTIGKKKYAANEEFMKEILKDADELKNKLTTLIDTDTEAFNRVSAVFSMPKETDAEKKARQEAMQASLKSAAEVPLMVMENCVTALKLTLNAVGKSNESAASDLGVAALGLGAGIKGAWLNVKINLKSIKDESYVNEISKKGESLLVSAENLVAKIYENVLTNIGNSL